jgi:hypothetical protein
MEMCADHGVRMETCDSWDAVMPEPPLRLLRHSIVNEAMGIPVGHGPTRIATSAVSCVSA